MLSGYALAFVGVRIGGALNEAGLRHLAYIVTAILYVGGAIAFDSAGPSATQLKISLRSSGETAMAPASWSARWWPATWQATTVRGDVAS